MKLRFLVLAIFGTLLIAPSPAAAAQDCDFKKELLELQMLKTADPAELVQEKELEIRRSALASITNCLINSTENILSNVNSLPYHQQSNNLRIRFQEELRGNIFFYKEKKKEIESMDIEATKLTAKEVLNWKKNHSSDLDRAAQFVIWGQNQELLQKASLRLAQIYSFIKKPNNKALETAKGLISQAEKANSLAQESFERSVPPSESLGYIKSSLDAMHNAYKNFLKL